MSTTLTPPIIVERAFTSSADALWRTLTYKDEMKQWYFDLSEFKVKKILLLDLTN